MYYNEPMETASRKEIERIQLERLQTTVNRMYKNVEFYRKRMQEKGIVPEDIRTLSDLSLLPFMSKVDLRDNYPFGTFAVPRSEIVRLHASSGTTGKPIVAGYTQNDLRMWAECVARGLCAAGVSREDTVQVAYGYGLFTGGLGVHYGIERLGATVVPISAGNTKKQIMMMQDLGTTVLACTPSYALMVGETIRDSGDIDLDSLKLRVGIFGAEPWTEGMRRQIENLLHIKAIDIYGLTETVGPGVAMECAEECNGLHIWEDYFIPEIVDPDTGKPLPDGQIGELVITTIGKEGMPTVRFRTHDLTYIIPEPCSCGRTHRRLHRLLGRTDDMLIIRGVNVFPSQVETAITGIEGIAPRYLLVVDRVRNLDTLEVQVELLPTLVYDEVRKMEALRARVQKAIEQILGLSVSVRLMPPNSIQRSEGKSVHILDKRKLDQRKGDLCHVFLR